jgi:phosphate transport system substrate-binding protein
MSGDPSAQTAPETPAVETPAATGPPVVRRRQSHLGLIAVVVVIVIIAAVVGVGYQQKWFGGSTSSGANCATGVTLQGDGAQFAAPLMTAWTNAYASATGNQVNYPASGSGTGLTHFSENPPLIDFAVTDEPLSASQLSAMPSAPLTLPIVGGALAIIYNLPGLSGHLNLTGALLAEIYNGNITTWNNTAIQALNPGVALPPNTIVPMHRADPAGTTYVLTDLLSQDAPFWNTSIGEGISVNFPSLGGTALAIKGNALLLSTVVSTKYAIGYSDLTDVLTDTSQVQYAAIENPAHNFVVPTLATTASAIDDQVAANPHFPTASGNWFNVSMVNAKGSSDYPLATFVYLYVYQATDHGFAPSKSKSEIIVQWLHWILSTTGQSMTDETSPSPLYYVALPSVILTDDNNGISTMTFDGDSIPSCSS